MNRSVTRLWVRVSVRYIVCGFLVILAPIQGYASVQCYFFLGPIHYGHFPMSPCSQGHIESRIYVRIFLQIVNTTKLPYPHKPSFLTACLSLLARECNLLQGLITLSFDIS